MAFVLDASVALAWHFDDEAAGYPDRVLERLRDDNAIVPAIWPLKVANALAVAERRGRISAAGVARAAELLLELPVSIQDSSAQFTLGPVLDLARAQGLTAYDAAYLELSMRAGLALATKDDVLRAAALRAGVPLLD